MKITELHVDSFGIWSGLSLTDLSDRVTVLFGRNETGKTTLMQFFRAMFYGFTSPRRYDRFARGDRPVGGALRVDTDQGQLLIRRQLQPGEAVETLQVTDLEQGQQRPERLAELLADVDEAVFSNVFAIGLADMQQLAALNKTAAARQLYDLTQGLDRVCLTDVVGRVEAERNAILSAEDEPSEVAALFERHEQLEAEIQQLQEEGQRWFQAARQQAVVEQQRKELEQATDELEAEIRLVETAMQLRPQWLELQQLDQQLAALDAPTELDQTRLERIDQLTAELTACRNKLQRIRRQRQRLRKAGQHLPLNNALWRLAARIEALGEQQPWIESLQTRIAELEETSRALAQQLAQQCKTAGLPLELITQTPPALTRSAVQLLKQPAAELRAAAVSVQQARRQRGAAGQRVEQLQRRLANALRSEGQEQLTEALRAAGEVVGLLRRRIQLEQRLDTLAGARQQAEESIEQLLDRQLMTPRQLAALGAPFGLGLVLIAGGIIWSPLGSLGWPLALFGLAGWGLAVAIKYIGEQGISRQLETCNLQLERIRQEIDQTRSEQQQIDRQLPAGGGPLDVRLQAAQRRLEELEQLLPLDAQLQAAKAEYGRARQKTAKAEAALLAARNKWQMALRAVGLPSDVLPKGRTDFVEMLQHLVELHRQLERHRRELDEQREQWQQLGQRIDQLSGQAGIEPGDAGPAQRLAQLLAAVADQRPLMQRRQLLRQRYRRLGRLGRRCQRQAARLTARRRRLLAELGVSNVEELQQLVRSHADGRQLRQRRAELNDHITAALQGSVDREQIADLFRRLEPEALEQHWDALVAELEDHQQRLNQLHEQRGRLAEQLRSGRQDRRLDLARLELSCVKQQLKQAVRRWQVLAVTGALLQSVRQTYEAERQPETLRRATRYLSQLTQDRYTRIWTPLGEQTLRIDAADGGSFTPEMLSRGTREAVYLSLRLALAMAYAERGVSLPLVLDDVLVNFDAERAKAAARTLRDLAKTGHQVLLFTCHDHIVKAFKAVKADIRTLPDHPPAAVVASRHRPATTGPRAVVAGAPSAEAAPAEQKRAARDADAGERQSGGPGQSDGNKPPWWDEQADEAA